MTQRKLLDLYSCAGMVALGYARAGFQVTGVDIGDYSDRYPFNFIRGDALEYLENHGHEYDAIHASPPCQYWSSITPDPSLHKDWIAPTRELLTKTTVPWVMENVPEAPMINPVMLCGTMFEGLKVYRHRLFEFSFPVSQPEHPQHIYPVHYPYDARRAGDRFGTPFKPTDFVPVYGSNAPIADMARAMGINVNSIRKEDLVEGLPPKYGYWLGGRLMEQLDKESHAPRHHPTHRR